MDEFKPRLIDSGLVHRQVRLAPNTIRTTDNNLAKLIQLFHQQSDAVVLDPVCDIFGVNEYRNSIGFLMRHGGVVSRKFPNMK
jgi:hypothetical protein